MVKFIITGHGKFSNGVFDAINFIMGIQKDVYKVEFNNIDLDIYSNKLEEIVKESEQGTVIFTDLIGGTPFRISCLICTKYNNAYVVTGTNVPMLIEAIIKRDNLPLKKLIDQIIDIGKNGIQAFDEKSITDKAK